MASAPALPSKRRSGKEKGGGGAGRDADLGTVMRYCTDLAPALSGRRVPGLGLVSFVSLASLIDPGVSITLFHFSRIVASTLQGIWNDMSNLFPSLETFAKAGHHFRFVFVSVHLSDLGGDRALLSSAAGGFLLQAVFRG